MRVVRPLLIFSCLSLIVYVATLYFDGANIERVRLSNCQRSEMDGVYYS